LREELRLKVLIIPRKTFEPKGEDSNREDEESCIMRSFIIYIFCPVLLG
jgi:hypothetical protein